MERKNTMDTFEALLNAYVIGEKVLAIATELHDKVDDGISITGADYVVLHPLIMESFEDWSGLDGHLALGKKLIDEKPLGKYSELIGSVYMRCECFSYGLDVDKDVFKEVVLQSRNGSLSEKQTIDLVRNAALDKEISVKR